MSEGPIADQRQGQRPRKRAKGWLRHLRNPATIRTLISFGRLIVEMVRILHS
jgi:hypothetical protein